MRLRGSISSEATDATACRPIGDVSVAEPSHGMINNRVVVTAWKGAAIGCAVATLAGNRRP
jgi:hypothetical protein